MILASFYIVDRFKLNATAGITPIHTPIAWWTLGISIVGLLLLAIPGDARDCGSGPPSPRRWRCSR